MAYNCQTHVKQGQVKSVLEWEKELYQPLQIIKLNGKFNSKSLHRQSQKIILDYETFSVNKTSNVHE